jgi:hypothetical protein
VALLIGSILHFLQIFSSTFSQKSKSNSTQPQSRSAIQCNYLRLPPDRSISPSACVPESHTLVTSHGQYRPTGCLLERHHEAKLLSSLLVCITSSPPASQPHRRMRSGQVVTPRDHPVEPPCGVRVQPSLPWVESAMAGLEVAGGASPRVG